MYANRLIKMFPTHVGMNRHLTNTSQVARHVPHTRGDEPSRNCGRPLDGAMFPTHVGMNREIYQGAVLTK